MVLTLGRNYDVSESIVRYGTFDSEERYVTMNEGRAEHYRRAAEQCFEQAALAPDEPMKVRMRFLADQWLQLAAAVSIVDAA